MIYKMALSNGKHWSLVSPPLAMTNRQIREECLPIFYSENKFVLLLGYEESYSRMWDTFKEGMKYIQKLRICARVKPNINEDNEIDAEEMGEANPSEFYFHFSLKLSQKDSKRRLIEKSLVNVQDFDGRFGQAPIANTGGTHYRDFVNNFITAMQVACGEDYLPFLIISEDIHDLMCAFPTIAKLFNPEKLGFHLEVSARGFF